ncbi:MAG: hypothetical protein WCP77_03090 [Roseococcus sp.]
MIEAYDKCTAAVAAKPEYRNIQERLSLPGTPGMPSMLQMQDTSRATPADQVAFVAWHSELARCRVARNDNAARMSPQLGAIYGANTADVDAILVRVASREITYGDASRALAVSYAKGTERVQQFYASIVNDLQNQHVVEVMHRRAMSSAVVTSAQHYSLQQQIIAARMPQAVNVNIAPSTTSCYMNAGSMICNTR